VEQFKTGPQSPVCASCRATAHLFFDTPVKKRRALQTT